MKNKKFIKGSIAGFGLFALAFAAMPVLAHYSDNGSGQMYRYNQSGQNYEECPMHEEYQKRAMNRSGYSGGYGGFHRGMMR